MLFVTQHETKSSQRLGAFASWTTGKKSNMMDSYPVDLVTPLNAFWPKINKQQLKKEILQAYKLWVLQ